MKIETRGRKKLPDNMRRRYNIGFRLNDTEKSILMRVKGNTMTDKICNLINNWNKK